MKGRDLFDLLVFIDLSNNDSPGEEDGWDGYDPRKEPKRVSQGETGQATDQRRKLQNHVIIKSGHKDLREATDQKTKITK